jgi:tyrosyl-tRNA synthetase
MPDEMPEHALECEAGIAIANLLKDIGLVKSTSEGMRMIKQGAVKIDGEKCSDNKLLIEQGFNGVVQVGKRKFARVTIS